MEKHYKQEHLTTSDKTLPKLLKLNLRDKDGKEKYVWQTSWGVSTRMIGALIMAHSDDALLIVPQRLPLLK